MKAPSADYIRTSPGGPGRRLGTRGVCCFVGLVGGAGLFAHVGGSGEQVFAGGLGVGGFGDWGEVEVPLGGVFEVGRGCGGGEVDDGVFVEGCLGLAEFVDVFVAGLDELDVVAAVEGEACFDRGDADFLVVEDDACAGRGGGDADFALDAGGEEEEGQEAEGCG